jgi:hypothetical protein
MSKTQIEVNQIELCQKQKYNYLANMAIMERKQDAGESQLFCGKCDRWRFESDRCAIFSEHEINND